VKAVGKKDKKDTGSQVRNIGFHLNDVVRSGKQGKPKNMKKSLMPVTVTPPRRWVLVERECRPTGDVYVWVGVSKDDPESIIVCTRPVEGFFPV
jgi:hypothetical protein